jgi:hypothetical protein
MVLNINLVTRDAYKISNDIYISTITNMDPY